jgi:hypothetical protein
MEAMPQANLLKLILNVSVAAATRVVLSVDGQEICISILPLCPASIRVIVGVASFNRGHLLSNAREELLFLLVEALLILFLQKTMTLCADDMGNNFRGQRIKPALRTFPSLLKECFTLLSGLSIFPEDGAVGLGPLPSHRTNSVGWSAINCRSRTGITFRNFQRPPTLYTFFTTTPITRCLLYQGFVPGTARKHLIWLKAKSC